MVTNCLRLRGKEDREGNHGKEIYPEEESKPSFGSRSLSIAFYALRGQLLVDEFGKSHVYTFYKTKKLKGQRHRRGISNI